MRLPRSSLRHCVLLLISILTYPSWRTVAQTTGAPTRITQAVDQKSLVVLKGNVHPLARPDSDQGPVADAQPLRRMLLLLQRTPEQFGTQFGLADLDIRTLTQWLKTQGFTDIKVSPGRTVIEFSGTVASVRNGFHTDIHRYLVGGVEHVANASDPQIPAALKPAIAGIVSLHSFRKKPMYHLAGAVSTSKAMDIVKQAGPEFTYTCFDYITGNSVTCHPLGPYDFATIYNVLPLWSATSPIDGTGQTIAIVGRTNINVQD